MRAIVNKADSARVFRNIDRMVMAVRGQAVRAAKQAGDEYTDLIKNQIITSVATSRYTPIGGREAWEPLSKYWIARKKSHQERFWMETGGIFHSIRTDILLNTMLIIEIFAGIRRHTDPQAFRRAMRNEYGIGFGPARPLFGPGADAISYRVGGGMRKLIKGSAIYWLFYKVPQIAARRVYGR